VGLLRREVDAIFLKGAQATLAAAQFGLVTVIDTGIHPEPLIRANNGTPRTLTVDLNLIEKHFDSATLIVEQVLRAEAWAHVHPDETRRFLARESNTSEYNVTAAYGENAHERLRTDFSKQNVEGIQDFIHFLHRWNFIPHVVDIAQWIDSRPYEAALSGIKKTA
jgi:ABC-type nitrate/sulfonate/bicarbonate transport system substrate-binding protein